MMVLKYITRIFTGINVSVAEIPEILRDVKKEEVNESKLDDLLTKIIDVQKNERLLLITNHQPTVRLISALNENISHNKISVLCNNELNTKDLEDELEKLTVHTADGESYFPEPLNNLHGVYHDDDRIILKRTVSYGETVLYNWQNEPWGVILNKEYHSSNIRGTVSAHLNEMNIKDKAKLMLELTSNNDDNTYDLSDIIMLDDDCGTKQFIILPDAVKGKKFSMIELELFTGLPVEAGIGKITEILANSELPPVLIEDINAVIINMHIPSKPLPDCKIIRNSMERICLK